MRLIFHTVAGSLASKHRYFKDLFQDFYLIERNNRRKLLRSTGERAQKVLGLQKSIYLAIFIRNHIFETFIN